MSKDKLHMSTMEVAQACVSRQMYKGNGQMQCPNTMFKYNAVDSDEGGRGLMFWMKT